MKLMTRTLNGCVDMRSKFRTRIDSKWQEESSVIKGPIWRELLSTAIASLDIPVTKKESSSDYEAKAQDSWKGLFKKKATIRWTSVWAPKTIINIIWLATRSKNFWPKFMVNTRCFTRAKIARNLPNFLWRFKRLKPWPVQSQYSNNNNPPSSRKMAPTMKW